MVFKNFKANLIPFIIASALFMDTLDSTILSTAIPTMANYFMINPISLKLAITSYLLSLAVVIPISGFVAEKFAIKKVLFIL